MENSMDTPQNIKNKNLPYNLATSEDILKGDEISILKRYLHFCVPGSPIHNSQDLGTNWSPLIDNWIKKMWCIQTMEYHSALKKDNIPFVTMWMDLEDTVLIKINAHRKTDTVCSYWCVESQIVKLIEAEGRTVVTRAGGGRTWRNVSRFSFARASSA